MKLTRKLENGHAQCLTCVETSHHDRSIIITGAERGELCLWSASDGSLIKNLKLKKRDDLSGIACSRLKPQFFVSAYRQVFSFDIRYLDKPITRVAVAGDCINQIAIDEGEKRLAFAEDSGEIEIFDLEKKCFTHVLEEHSNICNTVTFRNKSTEMLFSGGMDNLLLEWNIDEERVQKRMDMSEVGAYSEDLGPMSFFVVSPPFVHSLSISRNGKFLSCGTENALVCLFDTSAEELKCVQLYRRHNKGVSQVHFPKFSDDIVLSAGNDFRLCAWKVPTEEIDQQDPADDSNVQSGTVRTDDKPLYEITTKDKINWLSSGSDGSNGFLVAVDSSTTPSLYSFQL